MRVAQLGGWVLAGVMLAAPAVADTRFAGRFEGTGRACSGALILTRGTLDWRSTYSTCRARRYEIQERRLDNDAKRLVLRLVGAQRPTCPYAVIELEQATTYGWNVSGFRSMQAYENRTQPAWSRSALPERYVLSCLMTKVD